VKKGSRKHPEEWTWLLAYNRTKLDAGHYYMYESERDFFFFFTNSLFVVHKRKKGIQH